MIKHHNQVSRSCITIDLLIYVELCCFAGLFQSGFGARERLRAVSAFGGRFNAFLLKQSFQCHFRVQDAFRDCFKAQGAVSEPFHAQESVSGMLSGAEERFSAVSEFRVPFQDRFKVQGTVSELS